MRTNRGERIDVRKKPGRMAVAAFVVLLQLAIAPIVLAANVTLSWSFNYSVDVPCSAAVTKNCVSGFEYGTTPDGGTTLVKLGTVANPTTSATGTATNVTVTFVQGPPYGAVIYYARTSGLDGNGNVLFSAPALASTVQIVPSAPSSLQVTVH